MKSNGEKPSSMALKVITFYAHSHSLLFVKMLQFSQLWSDFQNFWLAEILRQNSNSGSSFIALGRILCLWEPK